jgi:hypothetical protein
MFDLAELSTFVYRILPYLFAIWLVVMSDFTGGYLRSLVDLYMDRKKSALKAKAMKEQRAWTTWDDDVVDSDRLFVKDLVSDSVLRVNFLNAMLAALISAVAATSSTQSFLWLAVALVFLATVYVPLLAFLLKLGPGQLLAQPPLTVDFWGQKKTFNQRPYLFYRKVLILINSRWREIKYQ